MNLTRGSVVCERGLIADRPLLRMRGLLGRQALPSEAGLLLTPARSIHTGFMRFPIDAVFLDGELEVIRMVSRLGPWQVASAGAARAVLELAQGESARRGLEVGDRLAVGDAAQPATAEGAALVARSPIGVPVGAMAAALAALAFLSYPLGADAAIAAFVAAVLVAIAAIDIRTFRIPNRIVLPATAIVLIAQVGFYPDRAPEFLLAALLGGAVLLLPHMISSSWMGMGDVKLGMLLGAALGWGVIGALAIAFLATLPISIALLVRHGRSAGKTALPFGPFMALGAMVLLIGPRLA